MVGIWPRGQGAVRELADFHPAIAADEDSVLHGLERDDVRPDCE